jgi:hypothetical protein
MNAPKRGRNTFVPLRDYPSGQDVVEIAVRDLVRNMEEMAMQVLRMQGESVLATIWERRRHP